MAHNSSANVSSSTPIVTVHNDSAFSSQNLVVLKVASQAPLHLMESTYFPWLAQFDYLLIAYDLYGYVDVSKSCPSPTFTDASTNPPSIKTNPKHIFWVRQDKFLLNALLASLAPKIGHLVATATTSYAVETTLATHFAKPSRFHILHLRQHLIEPQGTRPIATYLLDVQTTATELALLNMAVSDEDLALNIINGLSPKLKDIAAAFRTRESSISFADLHEQLIKHDSYLKRIEPPIDTMPISAHIANRS
nr:uncharacterized protein LOC125421025 [Ziziphus jujuba var. spinosa]